MMALLKRIMLASALLIAAPLQAAPDALADLAWLEGNWEGTGIDGAPATEVYSPAAGGQMVGHFRQLKPDGSAMFFELITIGKKDGVVTYSLKHFNADLTGWEERAVVRHFPLTSATDTRFAFSGIVYERTGPDSMMVTVNAKADDGSDQKLDFQFKRVKR